jgi:type II secretory pathway component PulC
VVTRVNGASLEKPDQANQVFQGLRTAPRLDIELVRQGVPRRVSLAIVD